MAWLRLDEDVFEDPRVVDVGTEQGMAGLIAWIYTLTAAKRQNRKGTVELAPRVMARALFTTPEIAGAAVASLVTAGLVELDPRPNTYVIRNWSQYQNDPTNAARQAVFRAK